MATIVLLVVVLLSLIRVRASQRLSPPPSVTARALERQPARVTRQVDRRGPSDTKARSTATPPRPLLREKEEPVGHPELAHIRSIAAAARQVDDGGEDQSGESPPLSEGVEAEVTPIAPITEIGASSEKEPIEAPEVERPPAAGLEPTDFDLSSINGIGPAFEAKLTDLGIEDVGDLAALDEEDVAVLMEYLGRFGKRVVTQDWVGQARRLIGIE